MASDERNQGDAARAAEALRGIFSRARGDSQVIVVGGLAVNLRAGRAGVEHIGTRDADLLVDDSRAAGVPDDEATLANDAQGAVARLVARLVSPHQP